MKAYTCGSQHSVAKARVCVSGQNLRVVPGELMLEDLVSYPLKQAFFNYLEVRNVVCTFPAGC